MRYDLSRLKVLVVDDSSFMTEILGVMLGALQFKDITVAHSVPDAVKKFWAGRYDIVLTDWQMDHGGSGHDLVNQIRKADDSPDRFVTIFAVSAHTSLDKIRIMLMAGVDDVLVKPVSAKLLYHRLLRAIENPGQFARTDGYFGPARNLDLCADLGRGNSLLQDSMHHRVARASGQSVAA